MSRATALVVDDEPDLRELLSLTLSRMDIDSHCAEDLSAARAQLQRRQFDLCLTDMRLPDGSGLDLVRDIAEQRPDLPVAVITAYGNMELAVEALKAGAFDFVSKPIDLEVLRRLVDTALKLGQAGKCKECELLGQSTAIERIRELIRKLSRSQAPVYISGESGTGKELVARRIHAEGPRAEHAFVAVNCGAIPQELMESEFFGHQKGSFTGATTDKQGLFHAADGGTLFLDEVADLPMHMQVKLLRAIQEKTVRRIGANKEDKIDARIISATHKNLADMVQNGEFRQDLFYRINVIEVHVPPLRKRPDDIAGLAAHFLGKQNSDATLRQDALATLQQYNFPGNVRELENILERATTMCEGGMISAEDLLLDSSNKSPPMQIAQESDTKGLDDLLGDIEKKQIMQALESTRWNRTAAAKQLGITFRQLRYRLKKLGLED